MNPRYKNPAEKLDEVISFFEPEITCPCCQETWVCLEDCEYQNDDWAGWARMAAIRELFSTGKE